MAGKPAWDGIKKPNVWEKLEEPDWDSLLQQLGSAPLTRPFHGEPTGRAKPITIPSFFHLEGCNTFGIQPSVPASLPAGPLPSESRFPRGKTEFQGCFKGNGDPGFPLLLCLSIKILPHGPGTPGIAAAAVGRRSRGAGGFNPSWVGLIHLGKVWGGEEGEKSKECGCNFRVEASEAGAVTMGIQRQEKPDLPAILAQKKRN